MCALVLAQVPDPDITPTITRDNLPLIWMDDHVVDRNAVIIAPLDCSILRLPHFHPAIFRASYHPLSLAVEGNTCYVARMTREYHHRSWICGANIEKLDIVISSCSEVALVWGDAQAVHLGVRMLNRTMAYARKSFPKPDCMVIAS